MLNSIRRLIIIDIEQNVIDAIVIKPAHKINFNTMLKKKESTIYKNKRILYS